ncbi:MAG: hypothetical protein CME70_17165 [Halobacteriovorax sp.]|nr:hypothetical protein [Halobacteriovorax sp.]|tara:strand:- start:102614 stop:103456 length:843 start_codon:yes stop_codon:yes gene_type:complete
MKLLTLLLLLICLSSCLGGTGGTTKISTGGAGPIAPGTPIRWSNATLAAPLDINTSTDFTNAFVAADLDGSGRHPIDQMSKLWNDAHTGYTFIKIPSDNVANKAYANVSDFRDGEMGVYKSFTWFSNVSSSALAITQFFGFRRNVGTANEYIELNHADIIVNYRDYDFSTDSSSTSDYDLHSVILHEMGHLLGLSHNWNDTSVMGPFLGITQSNRSLYAADVTTINNNYQAGNPITAGGGGGFATFSPVPGEGDAVEGMFELRADGKCHHTVNGVKVLVH